MQSPYDTIISLEAVNGRYVRVNQDGRLTADGNIANSGTNRDAVASEEQFRIMEFGVNLGDEGGLDVNDRLNDVIALASQSARGGYVTALVGGDGKLTSGVGKIDAWEKFKLEYLDGNKVALKAANGKYVTAEGGGGGPLIARGDAPRSWEMFVMRKSFAAGSGDYWFPSYDVHPVIRSIKIALDIATDLASVPGGSVIGFCFDLLYPEQQSTLEVDGVRRIVRDEIAKGTRNRLMLSLKGHEKNWNSAKDLSSIPAEKNWINSITIDQGRTYLSSLVSLKQDVVRDVEQSICLAAPQFNDYRLIAGRKISKEELIYTLDCFGLLSWLHVSIVREMLAILNRFQIDGYSKNSLLKEMNDSKDGYVKYANAAIGRVVDDRLSFISEIREVKELDYLLFSDTYYEVGGGFISTGSRKINGGFWNIKRRRERERLLNELEKQRQLYIAYERARFVRDYSIKVPVWRY